MGETGPGSSAARRPNPPELRRSLVIPMFHERNRIPATLHLLAASELNAEETEFILVDDGSGDGTADVAREVARRLDLRARVLARPHRGKGAAVARGVLDSRGATIVFTDADLSAGIGDVEACFEAVETGGADVVAGTRAHIESDVPTRGSWMRKAAGWGYNYLLRTLGLTSMRDTQCGLKGFRREAALALFSDLRTDGLAFDIEILARAERAGLRVADLPVTWSHMPGSRVRVGRDAARMTMDSLRIRRIVGAMPRHLAAVPPADVIEPGPVAEVVDLTDAREPHPVSDIAES